MKKETYEKQKVFAGKLKPSMLRRCVGHDYMERRIYMVTMTVEGRYSLFGYVEGRSDAPFGSTDAPRMTLNELGKRVEKHFYEIETRYPQIEVIAVQMMPDHLHGILFVKERLPRQLGQVIAGFKSGCNKDYREIIRGERGEPSVPPSISPSVPSVVALPQQTKPSQEKPQRPPRSAYNRTHGLLFSAGFNDRLLLREGQLKRWIHYLYDNPRRLLMKREHPDLFRVQRNLHIGKYTFSAIGNRLLFAPWTHHQDKRLISRGQCLSLNEMAQLICESDIDVFTYSFKS